MLQDLEFQNQILIKKLLFQRSDMLQYIVVLMLIIARYLNTTVVMANSRSTFLPEDLQ